ncbi:rCG24213 [Rattus norvegicus]|uniref:RCG24213 n=1 Tax=Rattus norvegicus TaxID=10116 RepID=A6KAN6_RAT|nr:rCG24213 [Rattus norvegicus]
MAWAPLGACAGTAASVWFEFGLWFAESTALKDCSQISALLVSYYCTEVLSSRASSHGRGG